MNFYMKEYLNKSNIIIASIAIVIVALLIWGFINKSKKTVDNLPLSGSELISPIESTPVKKITKKVSVGYEDALYVYNGKIIQLSSENISKSGPSCQATPINVTYKNGTEIMIDNRTDTNRKVKLGGSTYSVSAYGFKIVKLSSKVLPATWLVDCDSQENIATILIQK